MAAQAITFHGFPGNLFPRGAGYRRFALAPAIMGRVRRLPGEITRENRAAPLG